MRLTIAANGQTEVDRRRKLMGSRLRSRVRAGRVREAAKFARGDLRAFATARGPCWALNADTGTIETWGIVKPMGAVEAVRDPAGRCSGLGLLQVRATGAMIVWWRHSGVWNF